MNREQAEKLLAALIFNDLDETSKAELTAYLQTDDELRYRLADLRMAVKLTDDAVNEGPDPVLGEQRLKQLKRLAKADKAKVWTSSMRPLAVAAVLIFAFIGLLMPSLSKTRRYASTTSSKSRSLSQLLPADKDGHSITLGEVPARPPASRPASRSPLAVTTAPAIRNSPVATQSDGDGVRDMLFNTPGGRAGGTGGMGMGGVASDRKYNNVDPVIRPRGTGDMDADGKGSYATGAYGRGMHGKENAHPESATFSTGFEGFDSKFEGGSGTQTGKESVRQQVAASQERLLKELQERRASEPRGAPIARFAGTDRRGSTTERQELDVAKEAPGKPITMESESTVRSGRGLSDKEVDAGGGVYQGPRGNRAAEPPARTDVLNIAGAVSNGSAVIYDRKVPYGWTAGEFAPQKPAVPVPTPAPSGSLATVNKKLDQLSEVAASPRSDQRVPLAGDVPLVGELFQKGVQPKENAEAPGQATGDITYPMHWSKVLDKSGHLDPGLVDSDSAVKMKVEQNAPSPGVMTYHDGAVAEETANVPSSSHFKVVPVNPWVLTDQDALSTFALDVDTASYALCQRFIRGGYLPPIGAVRMEEFINAFDYAYPQRDDQPFTVYAEGTPSPFAPTGQDLTLLKVAVKARTVGRDQRRAANLVFVVDASASMGQADRLPQVQAAANQLVDKLTEADRVSLITCANDARLHLEAVPARQKDTIHETINAIQPAGPTNLLAGLKLAYAMARKNFVAGQTNEVVLCSDGVANVGQTEAEAMLQEVAQDRKQAITLTCVGVGYGAYNDAFLEALANQGDGRYVLLDSSEPAQQALVGQLAASLENVASDARIQVQFNPNRVRRYRLIGYENRDIEDKRFRDDTVNAGAVGSGQCSTALYELELTAPRDEGVPPLNRGQDARDTDGTDLGTVFVRYRNVETGQMEEISRPLAGSIVRRRSVEEDPRLFLAAGAARFAEWLRQSEHAQNTALPDVQRLLDQVSAALPLDRDVQDLAALAHQAEGLPRAPFVVTP